MTTPTTRSATVERSTRETSIRATITLDARGVANIASGLGFLDHMLTSLAAHARIDIDLACKGDLHVDDHHTVEDCAIVLGTALDRALGERAGIVRFGFAYAPMDEALARAAIDCATRPTAVINLELSRERLGDVSCENIGHFFRSFATAARLCLHLDVLRGENDHHRAEAAFKAFAIALRFAIAIEIGGSASTKGVL
jgi:imidazoleglycerol phosphate dehydratase HisB